MGVIGLTKRAGGLGLRASVCELFDETFVVLLPPLDRVLLALALPLLPGKARQGSLLLAVVQLACLGLHFVPARLVLAYVGYDLVADGGKLVQELAGGTDDLAIRKALIHVLGKALLHVLAYDEVLTQSRFMCVS